MSYMTIIIVNISEFVGLREKTAQKFGITIAYTLLINRTG
jgi:hypothetical protein